MTAHSREGAGRWVSRVAVALFLLSCSAFAAEKAPEFSGNALLDGREVSLSQFAGKVPVLLEFGSIYCSSCITSIPNMVTLQNKYGADKLQVINVNLDAYGVLRARRFFAGFENVLNYPVLTDVGLQISRAYNVNTLPTFVLIGLKGEIAATFEGYDEKTSQNLDAAVRSILDAQQVPAVVQPTQASVLTPDNFTKTFQDSIAVVGLTGGRPGPFTLRLNGGSEKTAKISGKMFSVRTPLALGSNFIEIRYGAEGSQGSLAVVLFREPRMGEGPQVAFPEYEFHLADKEARCAVCHEMTPNAEGLAAESFCLRCHDSLANFAQVHGPITVGGCNPCHDFGSKPHRYDVVEQGANLCYSCHDQIREKIAKPYTHGPVSLGLCTVCHSPHSSPFKYQIRNALGDLCLSCHESLKPKTSMASQHAPFRNGRCSSCHDPHSSNNPKYFLREVGEGLCRLCHNEKTGFERHKHPVGRAPKFTVKGMTLDEAGNLTCFSCHDPHASNSERMSPVPGGCAGCHQV